MPVTWITACWFCVPGGRSVKVLPVAKNAWRSEKRGCGSVGRASPCQGEGRGFESRHPLGRLAQRERASLTRKRSLVRSQYRPRKPLEGSRALCPAAQAVHADVAQLVEHHLAKVRVAGSSPVIRSQSGIHTIPLGVVGWPRGEAAACKAVYTGSNPVPTSGDWRRGSALPSHGRGHWFDPSIAHHVSRILTGPASLCRRLIAVTMPDGVASSLCAIAQWCGWGPCGLLEVP